MLTVLSDIQQDLDKVDQLLVDFFSEIDEKFNPFFINLLSGGKRIRPALVILSHRLLSNRDNPEIIRLAAVTELVHVASLLHDDVMDAVILRRGQQFADLERHNKLSVIIADMILSRALTELTVLEDSIFLKIVCRTAHQMALGQLKETAHIGDTELSQADYFYIIEAKTACLFAACCEIGALASGFNSKQCSDLRNFGLNLGLAFQLQDDILDYWGYENKLGKPIGNDFLERKLTLPLIIAFNKAEGGDLEKLTNILDKEKITLEDFRWGVNLLSRLDIKEENCRKAMKYRDLAVNCLVDFPDNVTKTIMLELADYVIKREK